MATLSITTLSRTGYNLTDGAVAAAAGGDKWNNTGNEYAAVVNGGVGAVTVTFDVQATLDGLAVTDRTVSVGAGKTYLAGPFPVTTYNDSNGQVGMTYSGVTSLTVAVVKPGS